MSRKRSNGEVYDEAPRIWPSARRIGCGGKGLENSLWGTNKSVFPMSQQARTALEDQPYASEEWWRLSVVVKADGHIPGKRFALDREAMNSTGLCLSERAFLGARRLLEAKGLLRRVKGHSAEGSRAQW